MHITMTNHVIINIYTAIVSIIFFILSIILINLREVKLTKPLEDKYIKEYNKYFLWSSRILWYWSALIMLIVFFYDFNNEKTINDIPVITITLAIIMTILVLFQLAKYIFVHKYTKKRFK